MSRVPVPVFLLALLVTAAASAQTSDLTLRLEPDARYNAGEVGTIKATITNLGPDAAPVAGVRLTKPVQTSVGAQRFGCIEFADNVLCNSGTLAAGESREFRVPFMPPDSAGKVTLAAHAETQALDPNHDNDAATAAATVVRLPDLAVRIADDSSFRQGKTSRIYIRVDTLAALTPDSVTMTFTLPRPITPVQKYSICDEVAGEGTDETYRCTFSTFARDHGGSLYFDVLASEASAAVTIKAAVESPTEDWNPADNSAALTEPVFDIPDLDIRMSSSEALDANNGTVAEFTFVNPTDLPAMNVSAEVITYPGDADASAAGDGWTCAPTSPSRLRCTRASIAPHETTILRLPVHYAKHELRGGFGAAVTQKPAPDFRMFAQSASTDWVFYRPFLVTNTDDGGAGSLRQAILDANAECSADDAPPCAVRFAIPAPLPQEGWFTIAPRTPLPRVTVTDFAIDGGSQIFLFGGDAGLAHGLDLNAASAVVRGLTIGGFAGNGIYFVSRVGAFLPHHDIVERNLIGTDPTGDRAVPNGLRGLMAAGFAGEITANVMSGNGRSGVFLDHGSYATIRDNRFGVAAHSDAALGNGASAIYIGSGDIVVEHNVIANSGDFGVAVGGPSVAEVLENRIFGNAQPGIDIGLDGPTVASAPRITSAHFDAAAGETVIEGMIPTARITFAFVTWTAYVYANTRDEAGGETFLGAVRVGDDNRFELRVKGDLTGKYIDASLYQITDYGDLVSRASSEFGPRTAVR